MTRQQPVQLVERTELEAELRLRMVEHRVGCLAPRVVRRTRAMVVGEAGHRQKSWAAAVVVLVLQKTTYPVVRGLLLGTRETLLASWR